MIPPLPLLAFSRFPYWSVQAFSATPNLSWKLTLSWHNIFPLEEVEASLPSPQESLLTGYCKFGHAPPPDFCYTSGSRGALCSVTSVLNPDPKPNFKCSLNQRVPPWGLVRFLLLFPWIHRGLPHAIVCRFFKAFPSALFCKSPACVLNVLPVLRDAFPVPSDVLFAHFLDLSRLSPLQSVHSSLFPVYFSCFFLFPVWSVQYLYILRALLMTDVSKTWVEAILRVKWTTTVLVSSPCCKLCKSGLLNMIGQLSRESIDCIKLINSHW